MSLKRVNFTKNQIKVLAQLLKNANDSFDKKMNEEPDKYFMSGRSVYCCGYIEAFVETLAESGFAFLEY